MHFVDSQWSRSASCWIVWRRSIQYRWTIRQIGAATNRPWLGWWYGRWRMGCRLSRRPQVRATWMHRINRVYVYNVKCSFRMYDFSSNGSRPPSPLPETSQMLDADVPGISPMEPTADVATPLVEPGQETPIDGGKCSCHYPHRLHRPFFSKIKNILDAQHL